MNWPWAFFVLAVGFVVAFIHAIERIAKALENIAINLERYFRELK